MKLFVAIALSLPALLLPASARADMGGPIGGSVGGSIGGAIPAESSKPPPAGPSHAPAARTPARGGPAVLSFPINTQPDGWAALKAAPDLRAARLGKVPDGTVFLVVERVPGWVRVRLASGETGWIAARLVGCCRAPPP